MNTSDIIADFKAAMRQRGLVPPNDLVIGRIDRCPVEGARRGKKDGTYLIHIDEHPAGIIFNWKDGQGRQDWRYTNGSNGATTWTAADRAAFDAKIAARKKADDEKRLRLAEAVRRNAKAMLDNAGDADPAHPYLARKQIKSHGIKQRGDELLMPRQDMATGEVVNLQKVLPNGDKRNLYGGRTDNTWLVVGKPKPRGTIFVAEGFATAATAIEVAGHAAIVAFGKDNLKLAAVELRRQFSKAKIIICADDDWNDKDGNGGLTKAREAALASDALMAVPKFDADRTADYTDFNDLRRLSGVEAIREAIDNASAPSIDWPDIDPGLIEAPRSDVLEFPVHLFSPKWREWIGATAEGAGAPADYVGMGLLGNVAGVTGCGVFVEATSSWREPVVLWMGLVGAPSMGKSPTLTETRRLIDKVESEARKGDAERRRGLETRIEAAKLAEERWRDEVATAADQKKEPPLKPAAADIVEPFVPTQLVVEDATVESLVDVGRGNPRGVILWSDEMSGWLQNFSRYSGGNDRPFWLARWSAGPATVNRKNRPAVHVPRLGASVVGGIQPSRLGEICGDDDDGMASRFLFAWPGRPPYKPIHERRGGFDEKAFLRLQRISALAGNVEPLVLKLDAGAPGLLDEFCAEHHADAGDYDGLEAGWFGKGPGNVLRLAGVLTLLAWSETSSTEPPKTVTAEAVEDAAGLWSDYFLPVARAVFTRTGVTTADRRVRRIIAWIRRTGALDISVEDVRVGVLGRAVDAAGATALIERLVKGGVLRLAAAKAAKSTTKGGRPPVRWDVNPALHAPAPEGADHA